MITITMNDDYSLTSNSNIIPAQYSENIKFHFEVLPIYKDSLIVPGYLHYDGCTKVESAVDNYNNGEFIIPANAFSNEGVLAIAFAITTGEETVTTTPVEFEVRGSVNTSFSLPSTEIWQSMLQSFMDQYMDKVYSDEIRILIDKCKELQANGEILQELINLAINSCGQYKFENGFLFFKQADGSYGEGINLNVSVEEFESVVRRVTSLETNGVAIGDTLGIGSQVVYNGEDIPTGWKEVEVPFSNPNLLVNGGFPVWQRGESFTNIGLKYSADRWCIYSTTSNCVIEKVDNGVHISSIDGKIIMRQFIENVVLEKAMTFSIQYNNRVVKVTGVFNEGNSNVYTDNGVMVTFRKLSEQPYMTLFIEFDEPDITANWVKLELGELATPSVPRPYADELMLCQRYYQLYENMPILMTMRNGNYHYYYMNLITHTRTNGTVTLVNESIVDTNSNTMYSTPLSDFLYETNSKRLVARKTSSLPQHSVLLSSKIIIDAEIY